MFQGFQELLKILKGRVGKSISAQASHRTVRETLASYGSYHTNHFLKKIANGKTLLEN